MSDVVRPWVPDTDGGEFRIRYVQLPEPQPAGRKGFFLPISEDGTKVGPVEKWMVDYLRDGDPWIVPEDIQRRLNGGSLFPSEIFPDSPFYDYIESYIAAALAQLFQEDGK